MTCRRCGGRLLHESTPDGPELCCLSSGTNGATAVRRRWTSRRPESGSSRAPTISGGWPRNCGGVSREPALPRLWTPPQR